MINIVYLVILFSIGNSAGITTTTIPQANMKQCEINRKHTIKETYVYSSYCIVGVK